MRARRRPPRPAHITSLLSVVARHKERTERSTVTWARGWLAPSLTRRPNGDRTPIFRQHPDSSWHRPPPAFCAVGGRNSYQQYKRETGPERCRWQRARARDRGGQRAIAQRPQPPAWTWPHPCPIPPVPISPNQPPRAAHRRLSWRSGPPHSRGQQRDSEPASRTARSESRRSAASTLLGAT